MGEINPTQYVDRGVIENKNDLRAPARQARGASIWAHHTRLDVGCNIAKIATEAVDSCVNADLAVEILLRYNKTIRFLWNFPRTIRYAPLFAPKESDLATRGEILQTRLIAFPAAGSWSLYGSRRIDGTFIVLAKAVARDGPIRRHGFIFGRSRAKIHRVCRSSLSAECHAAISAADHAHRLQM